VTVDVAPSFCGPVTFVLMRRSKTPPTPEERRVVLELAARAELDPRTVQRARRYGPGALRAQADRERFVAAARELGVAILPGEERQSA
jgi:hypothetical protein